MLYLIIRYLYLCSLYAVVVVTGNELNNNPVDIINAMDGNLPPPFPGQNSVYTAAVYTRTEDIPTILVLGNDTTTTGPNGTVYINRRLNENTMYGVFVYIRLKSDNGVAVSNFYWLNKMYMHARTVMSMYCIGQIFGCENLQIFCDLPNYTLILSLWPNLSIHQTFFTGYY